MIDRAVILPTDRAVILPTAVLFASETFLVLCHPCKFATDCFIDKVKISFKKDYGSQLINSKTVCLFQQCAIYSFGPGLVRITRLERYGQERRFHFSQLLILCHSFAMSEMYSHPPRKTLFPLLSSILVDSHVLRCRLG